jgi:heme-degrading monooxygenase HmoA
VIVEVGLFRIEPGRAPEFAPVAEDIRAAFARGGIPGLRFFRMDTAMEDAGRWAVLVGWDSVTDHRAFVASAEGKRQGMLLDRFMIDRPEVFHLSLDDVKEGLR